MRIFLLLPFLFFAIISHSQGNYALTLNGTNQYITIGAPIATNSSYTKEAWVYITNSTGARNIISSANAPFWINSGTLSAGQAGAYSVVTDPTAFPLNKWVHVAVTYDASTTTMKLYSNGVLVSTNSSVTSYTSENTFIGSHQGSSSFLQGNVDEVRIWDFALTQAQIKQYMFNGPANNASGLLAYYKCNDSPGTTVVNSTGGSNGSFINGPGWASSPIQFGANALNFDGSNDNVVIPHVVSSDFTVEYWMKTSVAGSGGSQWYNGNGIVDAEVGGATNDWGTSIVGNKFAFGIGQSGFDVTIMSTSNVNAGSWVHVAVTWQQSTGAMKLYINGTLEASGTGSTNLRTAPPRITFGQMQTNIQFYNGSIDEVRIWSVVRTQAEIQANKDKELDPSTAGNLSAYYTFNQGLNAGTNTGITTVIDQKGNNNGTMSNFALSGASSNFVTQNSGIVVLPLQWLSFNVQKQGDDVSLNWSTASEQNTKDFTIQHSVNGVDWNNLTVMPAAGSSNTITRYNYVHSNPAKGINFYRILQKDIDGRSSYSDTRSVKFNNGKSQFSILNNPVVDGRLKVRIDIATTLALHDTNGKLLWKKQVKEGTETVDMTRYAKGLYLLKANNQVEKIVIQ